MIKQCKSKARAILHLRNKLRANLYKDSNGSVLLFMAIALTVILGFTALVTDVGIMYKERNQLQKAVDAAALAGVQSLPDNIGTQAIADAHSYFDYNRQQEHGMGNVVVVALPKEYKEDGRYYAVEVTANRDTELYFAKALPGSFKITNIGATAMAKVVPGRGVFPVGIHYDVWNNALNNGYEVGDKYILWIKDNSLELPSGEKISGWRSELAGEGCSVGANELERTLVFGINHVDNILLQAQGTTLGKMRSGVETRFEGDKCHLSEFFDEVNKTIIADETKLRECPRILIVPIVTGPINKEFQVVDLKLFYFEDPVGVNKNDFDSITVTYLGDYTGFSADSYVFGKLIK